MGGGDPYGEGTSYSGWLSRAGGGERGGNDG